MIFGGNIMDDFVLFSMMSMFLIVKFPIQDVPKFLRKIKRRAEEKMKEIRK